MLASSDWWPHIRETDGTWHTIDTSRINGVVTSTFAYSSLCKKQNGIFLCLRSGESLIPQYVKKRFLASKIFANFVSLYLKKETFFRLKTFRNEFRAQTDPKNCNHLNLLKIADSPLWEKLDESINRRDSKGLLRQSPVSTSYSLMPHHLVNFARPAKWAYWAKFYRAPLGRFCAYCAISIS